MFSLYFLALVLALLSCPVIAELAPSEVFYQYCAGNGNLTVDYQDNTASGPPRIDWFSYYQNSEKESVFLMVLGGDDIDDYKFYSYTKTDSLDSARKCTGTASYGFLGLLNQYMLLSNGAAYYVCKYTPGIDSTPVPLTTTGVVSGTLIRFIPHSVVSGVIHVMITDSATSVMVKYTYVSTGPLTPTLYRTNLFNIANPMPVSLASFVGSPNFIFDLTSTTFWNNTSTGWVSGTTATNITFTSSEKFTGYNLRDGTFILAINATAKTDRIYAIRDTTIIWSVLASTASTTNPLFVSDLINNFIRVFSTKFNWLTLITNNTLISSEITSTDVTDLNLVASVGLSQNKAVFYYSNGKIDYFKNVANNTVQRLFSRTITPTLTLTSTKNYQLSLSCLCQALKNTYCYSQTLTCIIVNKAQIDCKGPGDTYTTW